VKNVSIIRATIICLALDLALSSPALAFAHANRFGGSTSHTFGATSHTSAFGTSTSHVAGLGTSHSNVYGGSTTHFAYGGTTHTNVYGGTTSARYGAGAVHTTPYGTTAYASAYHPPTAYYGYHPPTTVGYYQAGCYHCGYGAAAAAGAAIGAAVGTSGTSAAAANANAAAANANAAAANAAAAAATAATVVPAYPVAYQMGAVYAALPAGGCAMPEVNGTLYYLCGNTWFSPAYGANGVYYRVVPTP
jgi:hypothetical protein